MNQERIKAINAINRYIYPMIDVNRDSLQYQRSLEAAEELKELILSNHFGSTFDIVDEYRTRMDLESLRPAADRIIYSIKYDFATYVLDELLLPF